MNERIKEFAEQAYLYQEHDTFLIAALENFAELIVRECAGVALNIGSGDIEDELLKHFGVSE
jgi:hypothetical protein